MKRFGTILLSITCLFGAVVAVAQSAGMQRYVNSDLLFELSYPVSYRQTDLPCSLAQSAASGGIQVLLHVAEGNAENSGKIFVGIDRREFSIETLQKHYAHTGLMAPGRFRLESTPFITTDGAVMRCGTQTPTSTTLMATF